MRPATRSGTSPPSARPMAARRPHPPPPLTHPSSSTQGPSNPGRDPASRPRRWCLGPPGSPQGEPDGNRGGVDVNDLADQSETGRRRVYGSYKLPRLVALKDRWDPEHVVHRNHHIRPTDNDLARPEGGTMRRIINSTYVSLDGVIEHPEQWQFDYLDDATNKFESDQLFASDALLMGRRTYQSFAEAWPSQSGPFADKINTMPKYVASTPCSRPTGPIPASSTATWSRRSPSSSSSPATTS
jgi:RibD C-terminal domain